MQLLCHIFPVSDITGDGRAGLREKRAGRRGRGEGGEKDGRRRRGGGGGGRFLLIVSFSCSYSLGEL